MIELRKVTKKFGKVTVLDIDKLSIEANGIYGIFGRNGAGKTTLLKALAGIIPTKGEIRVNGQKVTTWDMPRSINFIEPFTPHFNIPFNKLLRRAAYLRDNFSKEYAVRMADEFGLDRQKKYGELSLGMKTLVSTILTLADNANDNSNVILLDEPTLGFDSVMRERFKNWIKKEEFNGEPFRRRIFISTNLIDDIEEIVTYFYIIDQGKIIFKLDNSDTERKLYTLSGEAVEVERLIANLNCIAKEDTGEGTIKAYIYDEKKPHGIRTSDKGLKEFVTAMVGGYDVRY